MLAQRGRLEFMLPIAQAVVTSLDPDAVLRALVEETRGLAGVRAAAVFEYEEASSSLRVRCGCGLSSAYICSMTIPIGSLAVGRAFQTGQIEIVGDINLDPSFAPYLQLIHQEQYEAVAAVPLIARQHLLGILAIYLAAPYRPSEQEKDIIRTMSSLAAVALDNARLFQEQLRVNSRLEVLSKQLAEKSQLLSRALKAHEWLVRTVLTHDGIDAVSRALASLAEAPVAVEDTHLNLISSARPTLPRLETPPESLVLGLAGFTHDARVRDHINEVMEQRRAHVLPAIDGLGLKMARVTAPVILGERLLAMVSILANQRELGEMDHMLCEQGALAVGLELVKSRAAFEAENRIRGDILRSILAGKLEDLDRCSAVFATCQFDPTTLQRVLVVREDTPVGSRQVMDRDGSGLVMFPQFFRVVERVVTQAYPKSIVIARKSALTILLASEQKMLETTVRELGERLVSEVAARLSPVTVSVGAGGECRTLRDVRRSLREASRAADVASALRKSNLVILFSDLGVLELILRHGRPEDLREFADRYVAPLETYDKRHGSGLIETLETYIRRNYSLNDTARDLLFHPNTVKYRLQKIQDLCGIDLHNAQDLVDLQIALRLYRLTL